MKFLIEYWFQNALEGQSIHEVDDDRGPEEGSSAIAEDLILTSEDVPLHDKVVVYELTQVFARIKE